MKLWIVAFLLTTWSLVVTGGWGQHAPEAQIEAMKKMKFLEGK